LPEIYSGGQPRVRCVADGTVKGLLFAIHDRDISIHNNSGRTICAYEQRNHSGRWMFVTRSGGFIHDMHSYNFNERGCPAWSALAAPGALPGSGRPVAHAGQRRCAMRTREQRGH
jgi:hypothetical protein